MAQIDALVQWMLDQQILWDDQGALWLGCAGEETYGRRNFLELFSVFTSPPLFTVVHGREELGFVDEMTFLGKQDGPRVLLLGGRAWLVNHVDWQHRVAYVKATDMPGRSRWTGTRPELAFRLCQSIKHRLAGNDDCALWSRRARQQIATIRQEFVWLEPEGTVVLLAKNGSAEWWTFAGARANATLAHALSQTMQHHVTYDSFTVTCEAGVSRNTLTLALSKLRAHDVHEMSVELEEDAMAGLKFSECLPRALALDMLRTRLCDPAAVQSILAQPVRYVAV